VKERIQNIFTEMGGSDWKREESLEKALSFLPAVVVLSMTDKQIASYFHNVSQALHEVWREGYKCK